MDLETREALQKNFLDSTVVGGTPAVVLNTCGRFEVYAGQGLPSREVAEHLFRVTSGLDSAYLGEHQIQGQVKRAYQDACNAGCLDSGLHRLFQQALRVGKRVRSETDLSRGALGHAQTVVSILQRLPLPLPELRLLILGVNHLNRGILKYLVDRGQHTFFLGNRTLERAKAVVAELGAGEALPLDRLGSVLAQVDVVISATTAPHWLIHAHQLPNEGGPRWFFDLAVPRDIDPAVALRPGTTLYNVADLERIEATTRDQRLAARQAAEAIVREETARFFASVARTA